MNIKQLAKAALAVALIGGCAITADAQFGKLGSKLKDKAKKAATETVDKSKKKAKEEATSKVAEQTGIASESGTSSETVCYSTTPNRLVGCPDYRKTYKPSDAAKAADPDATNSTVSYGFNKSIGDIHAAYEQFDKSVSLYQPYYSGENKFFWELGGDDYQNRLGYYISYMKKNLLAEYNSQFCPDWAQIDPNDKSIVVPADETFLNPWMCQYIADPTSKTAFTLYIYAYTYYALPRVFAMRHYNMKDEQQGFVSDKTMLPGGFAQMKRARAAAALELATTVMPIETIIELAQSFVARMDNESEDSFSRFFNFVLAEGTMQLISKHDDYDNHSNDTSLRKVSMAIDATKGHELELAYKADAGPSIDEPKGVAVSADIKAAGTKAGKEYAGDKFEKVIFFASKWKTLKNPNYPYEVRGHVIDCAVVIKRGDKRQLQYTALMKSPDGSRYFMQAAGDALYHNLK